MRAKFIMVALAALLLLNLTHVVDRAGDDYFENSLKNAAVTFAVARMLNGIISVIQHVEVAATPAGVGLSIAPGQILDPLNDLVEQFSFVMMMATVSLAIQKLLLTFSSWWGAKAAMAVLMAMFLLTLVRGPVKGPPWVPRRLVYKMLLLLIFFRFALPFVALSSGIVERLFLQEPIQVKTEKLQLIEQTATGLIETDQDEKWFESILSSSKNMMRIKENATLLKEKLSSAIGTIIDLIALFIIQTILLPLSFLYVAVRLVKLLFVHDVSKINS